MVQRTRFLNYCHLSTQSKEQIPDCRSRSLTATITFLVQSLPIEKAKWFAIPSNRRICGVWFTSHHFFRTIIAWKELNTVSIVDDPIGDFRWCCPIHYGFMCRFPGEILPLFLCELLSSWCFVEGWIVILLIYCCQVRRWWYHTCQCQEKQITLYWMVDKWQIQYLVEWSKNIR